MGIWVTDVKTDKTIAEWWDDDARQMFEGGFFKPGDIRGQTIVGAAFEESVLDYLEDTGVLAKSSASAKAEVSGTRLWHLGEWWEKEYTTAEADVYMSADGKKRLYVFWDGRKQVVPREGASHSDKVWIRVGDLAEYESFYLKQIK